MEQINASLIMAVIGLVLFVLGGRMRFRAIMAHYRTKGGRLKTLFVAGKWSSIIGAAMLATGLYAGTYGPVTLGPLQLPVFEYEFVDRLRADALPFARTKLQLTGEPVVGWRGVSTKSVHVTVKNTGDRSVGYVVVRMRGAGGRAGYEEKLNGPFPPGRTKDLYPRLRPGVHAAYTRGKTDASYYAITKAKF